jgi:hypothetical protein
MLVQEIHHPTGGLQALHEPRQVQPIQTRQIQHRVPIQHIVDRHHTRTHRPRHLVTSPQPCLRSREWTHPHHPYQAHHPPRRSEAAPLWRLWCPTSYVARPQAASVSARCCSSCHDSCHDWCRCCRRSWQHLYCEERAPLHPGEDLVGELAQPRPVVGVQVQGGLDHYAHVLNQQKRIKLS